MAIENDLVEILATNVRSDARGRSHRPSGNQLSGPLSPDDLAKARQGVDAYVEARKVADDAGVSTMATVNRERALAAVEGAETASHIVVRGICKGEYVRHFQTDKSARLYVEIVAGPRKGKIMILDLNDLEKINKITSNE